MSSETTTGLLLDSDLIRAVSAPFHAFVLLDVLCIYIYIYKANGELKPHWITSFVPFSSHLLKHYKNVALIIICPPGAPLFVLAFGKRAKSMLCFDNVPLVLTLYMLA